jgi:hypothetical protein
MEPMEILRAQEVIERTCECGYMMADLSQESRFYFCTKCGRSKRKDTSERALLKEIEELQDELKLWKDLEHPEVNCIVQEAWESGWDYGSNPEGRGKIGCMDSSGLFSHEEMERIRKGEYGDV